MTNTANALRQRVERIEAAAVSTWWEGCRQLYEPFMERLTDDELREVAAAPDGNTPAWYTDRFNAFMAADPDRARQWQEVQALEQRLITAGYSYVLDERGVIVFPGLARP